MSHFVRQRLIGEVMTILQTLSLSAADLGLGACVSAAMNDQAIEDALELDPLKEGFRRSLDLVSVNLILACKSLTS
ncbi:nitroreductase family protein [Pseudomonas sp. SDO5522_S412]